MIWSCGFYVNMLIYFYEEVINVDLLIIYQNINSNISFKLLF